MILTNICICAYIYQVQRQLSDEARRRKAYAQAVAAKTISAAVECPSPAAKAGKATAPPTKIDLHMAGPFLRARAPLAADAAPAPRGAGECSNADIGTGTVTRVSNADIGTGTGTCARPPPATCMQASSAEAVC